MRLLLKMLIPYFAVGVGWCLLKNGWVAILVYHALVLICDPGAWKTLRGPIGSLWPALPTLVAGPLVYLMLPIIADTSIGTWLAGHGLSGISLILMVPYFGIIHPVIEQLHWAPLREQTPFAHLFFAGYHMLVLYAFLKTPWLIAGFAALALTSLTWTQLTRRLDSLIPAIASHIFADFGMILTGVFLMD